MFEKLEELGITKGQAVAIATIGTVYLIGVGAYVFLLGKISGIYRAQVAFHNMSTETWEIFKDDPSKFYVTIKK